MSETENATFIPAPPGMTVDLEPLPRDDGVVHPALVVALRVDGKKLTPYVLLNGEIVPTGEDGGPTLNKEWSD